MLNVMVDEERIQVHLKSKFARRAAMRAGEEGAENSFPMRQHYLLDTISPSAAFDPDDGSAASIGVAGVLALPPFVLFRLKSSMTVFILADSAALLDLHICQLDPLMNISDPNPQLEIDCTPVYKKDYCQYMRRKTIHLERNVSASHLCLKRSQLC
jgi:hypothetical protein